MLSDSFQVQMGVPARIVARRCCRVAFVRGAFLGCGSISPPGSAVHAEFTFESGELAEECRLLLGRLGLDFRVATRERNSACYSKRGETAADLLAVLGAHTARLAWEEHLVFGEVRGRANRLANCDQANAGRAARAAPATDRDVPDPSGPTNAGRRCRAAFAQRRGPAAGSTRT